MRGLHISHLQSGLQLFSLWNGVVSKGWQCLVIMDTLLHWKTECHPLAMPMKWAELTVSQTVKQYIGIKMACCCGVNCSNNSWTGMNLVWSACFFHPSSVKVDISGSDAVSVMQQEHKHISVRAADNKIVTSFGGQIWHAATSVYWILLGWILTVRPFRFATWYNLLFSLLDHTKVEFLAFQQDVFTGVFQWCSVQRN